MARRLNIAAATTEAPVRTRTRGTAPLAPTPQMLEDAQATYEQNKIKNAASTAERKSKERLHKAMIQGGISRFEFDGEFNGNIQRTEAVIDEDVVEIMDPFKLREAVDEETFMRIISATKTAVLEFAGEHVAMKVATEVTKPASLKLRKVS